MPNPALQLLPHKCTRYCTFEHAFGNLYVCQTSGMQHVCDANCDQGVYYDGAHVICRLSKVVRPLSTVEHVVRSVGFKSFWEGSTGSVSRDFIRLRSYPCRPAESALETSYSYLGASATLVNQTTSQNPMPAGNMLLHIHWGPRDCMMHSVSVTHLSPL